MNCLKCGREIEEDEVFCVDCRLDAQRYPVNPSTAVFIPRKVNDEPARKTPRRRSPTMEEQVKALRRKLRIQSVAIFLLLALAAAMVYPTWVYIEKARPRVGQNYSSMTTPPAPPETTHSTEPAA